MDQKAALRIKRMIDSEVLGCCGQGAGGQGAGGRHCDLVVA
jgi:hypothetical protein